MMEVYLTSNSEGEVEIDVASLSYAKSSFDLLSSSGTHACTDALPSYLFVGVITKEDVLKVFEAHQKDVERIFCSEER